MLRLVSKKENYLKNTCVHINYEYFRCIGIKRRFDEKE